MKEVKERCKSADYGGAQLSRNLLGNYDVRADRLSPRNALLHLLASRKQQEHSCFRIRIANIVREREKKENHQRKWKHLFERRKKLS